MTLTIELDLDMVHVDLHVKLLVHTSNGSVGRVLTDGQTDGTDSITSTAVAGGNDLVKPAWAYYVYNTLAFLVLNIQSCLMDCQYLYDELFTAH